MVLSFQFSFSLTMFCFLFVCVWFYGFEGIGVRHRCVTFCASPECTFRHSRPPRGDSSPFPSASFLVIATAKRLLRDVCARLLRKVSASTVGLPRKKEGLPKVDPVRAACSRCVRACVFLFGRSPETGRLLAPWRLLCAGCDQVWFGLVEDFCHQLDDLPRCWVERKGGHRRRHPIGVARLRFSGSPNAWLRNDQGRKSVGKRKI